MFAVRSASIDYRPMTAADWPFFLALHQDPDIIRYISAPRSAEDIRTHSFLPRLPPWQKGSAHWLCLVMSEKGSAIPAGVTGFIDRGDNVAEVGFILAPAFHGRGLGAGTLYDIARFAFDVCGYRRLTATVTAGNEASRRTLLKVGFTHEGTLRQNYFLQGRWQDDWLFGLLPGELCPAPRRG